MKFIDEFRSRPLAEKIISSIHLLMQKRKEEISLMEVCGTHTVAIFKSGIRELLPRQIRLLSGPGCPVCVTTTIDVDKAVQLARYNDVILVTFGDMMRVPGSETNLTRERAEGRDIRVVYSTLDALRIAKENPVKKVVFFAIGFETTSPTVAASVIQAEKEGIDNFYLLCSHKLIPPAMEGLLKAGEVKIDGFICPGHVSTIIGSRPYEFIPRDYGISCVIAGFEPLDILQSIQMLVKQVIDKGSDVQIQYRRCVKPEGNLRAQEVLFAVFEVCDANWRGLGMIPRSGLRLKKIYSRFDVGRTYALEVKEQEGEISCICGDILRGIVAPDRCPLFRNRCTPENPLGPCMVSSEGTCAAYYKYTK